MGLTEQQARELIGLGAGRRLRWTAQTPITEAAPADPPTDGDGVDVRDALSGRLKLQLRADARAQVATVEVTSTTDDTYTVTIAGVAYDYVASSKTIVQIAAGLASALAAASAVVTVTDNLDGTLTIEGATPTAYTIAVSTAGSGTMTLDAEASTVTWSLWFRSSDLPDAYDTWERYTFPDGSTSRTMANNYGENVDLNGMDEIFVWVSSSDVQGAATLAVLIGVGVRDDGVFDYV